MSEIQVGRSSSGAVGRDPGGTAQLWTLLGFSSVPMIDATIVNVAMPSIARELPASATQLQFVVAGYLLSYGALIITGARWGSRYGHVRVLALAMTGFVLASVACGFAPNAAVLVFCRVLQGMAAAPILPQVMSLIQRDYSGAALARALSLFSLATAGGFLIGQLGGGLLISIDPFGLGWRSVFLVNVPIGLILLAALRRLVEPDDAMAGVPMDFGGVFAGGATLALAIAALTFGRTYQWAPWVLALLVLAIVAAVIFVLVERHVAKRGGSPLVTAQALRSPGLRRALIVVVLVFANYAGFLFSASLYLQAEHHNSALGSALWFLCFAPGFVAVTMGWKRIPAPQLGRFVAVGAMVLAVGDLLLWTASRSSGSPGIVFGVALLVAGLGTGAVFGPILTLALRSVAPEHAAETSGVMSTMFQVGSAVGVATIGSVYLGTEHGLGAAALCLAVIAGVAAGLVAAPPAWRGPSRRSLARTTR